MFGRKKNEIEILRGRVIELETMIKEINKFYITDYSIIINCTCGNNMRAPLCLPESDYTCTKCGRQYNMLFEKIKEE